MKTWIIMLVALSLIFTLPYAMQKYLYKEYFTELYFNNPENLSRYIMPGQEYNFSFTIVSHEAELTVHDYIINFENESEKGQITLYPEKNQTIYASFTPQNEEGNVTVYLNNSKAESQSIYFFYRTIK